VIDVRSDLLLFSKVVLGQLLKMGVKPRLQCGGNFTQKLMPHLG
jgi:hypothetical protein